LRSIGENKKAEPRSPLVLLNWPERAAQRYFRAWKKVLLTACLIVFLAVAGYLWFQRGSAKVPLKALDHSVLLYLNRVADRSPNLTQAVVAVYRNVLKSLLILALIWWVWFDASNAEHQQAVREKIVAGLIGSVVCIMAVRLAAWLLPFRVRPVADPLNGLHFPVTGAGWVNWGSFPSDNAVLFFLLTVCLFGASRVLGSVALLDTIFLICFPRVFVGVHYPTDMIGGALIGIAAGYLVTRKRVRVHLAQPALRWMQGHPASFYASAFAVTFLFADDFWPVTTILTSVWKLAKLLM
jgi:undecaprenyl-diphosphatase